MFEMKKVESHIAHLKQGQGLGGANRQQLSPENFSINFSPPNPSSSFSLDLGEGFKKIRYGSRTVSHSLRCLLESHRIGPSVKMNSEESDFTSI